MSHTNNVKVWCDKFLATEGVHRHPGGARESVLLRNPNKSAMHSRGTRPKPSVVDIRGLVFIVLALDPRFASSKPAEDDRFLRAIKVRSSPSEGK